MTIYGTYTRKAIRDYIDYAFRTGKNGFGIGSTQEVISYATLAIAMIAWNIMIMVAYKFLGDEGALD
jgi:hypothetical protein